MKKLIAIFLFLTMFTIFASVVVMTPNTTLYFLNWGEYIDHSLVEAFEKENKCQVIEEDVASSEAMYQKITSNTTSYDVAIPGDYTVHQLYNEGYLRELDVKNSSLTNLGKYDTMFTDTLSSLMAKYMVDSKTGEEFNSYFCPYFWGAYSLIYSSKKAEIPSIVKANGFKALYDRGLYYEKASIGMYDTARWIVASYLMSKDYDPNITDYNGSKDGDLSSSIQDDATAALKKASFDEFGNDSLKRNVATGELDMCFTQLGDFFDVLYLVYSESSSSADISFNVAVPTETAAFFDSMVIPTTCQNYSLANKFIDFMMEPSHAYDNARAIGYSPTLTAVGEKYREAASNGDYYYEGEDEKTSLSLQSFLDNYPMYLDPLNGTTKVYMLEPKSNEYLTTCETIFNSLA